VQEFTLGLHLALNGERARVLQHRCGYVGNDNAQRLAEALDGTEGDQTFSGADVGQRHAWGKTCRVKHAIGVAFHLGAHDTGKCGIIAVPAMQ
jgi:hypothetical protein